uniref:Dzip-like_N domain-containing protein n=1 Tax=Angiostrongylus cantonensis TaxID=6313 RepID=A0A0K0DEC5_ANGCA
MEKPGKKFTMMDDGLPDWSLVARFSTLQAVLPSIIAVDVTSDEAAHRSQKLLRISQMQIEYLLKSQHQLLQQIKKLEDELRTKKKEAKQLKATILHSDAPFFKVIVVYGNELPPSLSAPRSVFQQFSLAVTALNSGNFADAGPFLCDSGMMNFEFCL